MKMHIYNPISQ